MVVALVTAPFYHLHDRDDHGTPTSLVHAHSFEVHEAESQLVDEIEAPHGHEHARWIDYFTVQLPPSSFALAIEFTEESSVPTLERREGIVLLSAPRAHSPPGGRRSVPRSPPLI
jgi:hypothetical protein